MEEGEGGELALEAAAAVLLVELEEEVAAVCGGEAVEAVVVDDWGVELGGAGEREVELGQQAGAEGG